MNRSGGHDTCRLLAEWLNDPAIDEETKAELREIADNPAEVEDRFFRELEFGTGGLRGVIGAGTNRINRYTVRKATLGLARYLREEAGRGNSGEGQAAGKGKTPSVVIAYDSRHRSPEFALEAALVLAGNGVKSYLFTALRPTPELSFAVRHLRADAGIVITASHNPPEYNGYKVYGADGGQLVPRDAEKVIEHIRRIRSFGEIRSLAREEAERSGMLEWIGAEVDQAFAESVLALRREPDVFSRAQDQFAVVYTPLHGAGNRPVRTVLEKAGVKRLFVVSCQEQPDPQFPTVRSPNPEEAEAFRLARELAEQVQADLIIGTDPDCDRAGVMAKNEQGAYMLLNGDQTGALLLHYLLGRMKEQGIVPENGAVVKTVVTGDLGAEIAKSYNLQVFQTLTGFKYVAEKIRQFERDGTYRFVFGYEESLGFLPGTHCRDKDAVSAALLICEAAAYYKLQGKTLPGVLQELYRKYGYFQEQLQSLTLKGKEGSDRIRRIMEDWREKPPAELNGQKVAQVLDYLPGIGGLPPENALKIMLQDGSWCVLRPSGTEPKLKVYFAVRGTSEEEAKRRMDTFVRQVMARVRSIGGS
jgi:phosphoglucomutase